jgi:hypothetical protein
LQISVVGLGFGMNVNSALAAGKDGFLFTIGSILSTLILGTFIGKWFKTDTKTPPDFLWNCHLREVQSQLLLHNQIE